MCFKHFVLNVAKLLLLRILKAMFKVYFERSIELCIMYYTHRVISDKEHRLLVTLSYYRPDRFVQFFSLLSYLLVSIDLVYTGLCELVPE